ncbi:MAG TPA: hypothetical protein VJ279_07955, partial [Hanamia sp.]|nr:hypothetical protein [Hanamia sp.]
GNFTVTINWKNGKLSQAKIYSALGGNCRISTLQPVKVVEVKSQQATGENPNSLFTVYGKPPFEKNKNARLVDVDVKKEYVIDFKTEKGKTYTIVPL